jgi:hypothetical protein
LVVIPSSARIKKWGGPFPGASPVVFIRSESSDGFLNMNIRFAGSSLDPFNKTAPHFHLLMAREYKGARP